MIYWRLGKGGQIHLDAYSNKYRYDRETLCNKHIKLENQDPYGDDLDLEYPKRLDGFEGMEVVKFLELGAYHRESICKRCLHRYFEMGNVTATQWLIDFEKALEDKEEVKDKPLEVDLEKIKEMAEKTYRENTKKLMDQYKGPLTKKENKLLKNTVYGLIGRGFEMSKVAATITDAEFKARIKFLENRIKRLERTIVRLCERLA